MSENDFSFLESLDPDSLYGLLEGETDSVVATVLKNISKSFSGKVFVRFPDDRRTEIAAAMATAKIAGGLLDILGGDIAEGMHQKAYEMGLVKDAPARPEKPGAAGKRQNSLEDIFSQVPGGSELAASIDKFMNLKKPEAAAVPAAKVEDKKVIPQKVEPAPQRCSEEQRRSEAMRGIFEAKKQSSFVKKQPEGRDVYREEGMRKELAKARQMAAGKAGEEIKPRKIDGMVLAANIVREASPEIRKMMLEEVPELYESLRERMFVFADLERSPDHTLEEVFSKIDPYTAAIALRFASDPLHERALKLVSARRKDLINDEVKAASGKRVRLTDIEEAQQKVIDFAVQLQEQGKVIIDPDDVDLV